MSDDLRKRRAEYEAAAVLGATKLGQLRRKFALLERLAHMPTDQPSPIAAPPPDEGLGGVREPRRPPSKWPPHSGSAVQTADGDGSRGLPGTFIGPYPRQRNRLRMPAVTRGCSRFFAQWRLHR